LPAIVAAEGREEDRDEHGAGRRGFAAGRRGATSKLGRGWIWSVPENPSPVIVSWLPR
jgi:hypothetical protein